MAQKEQIVIPIICENPHCANLDNLVNVVSGITTDDMDLFYESYDGTDAEDYCPVCGELGVAEDPWGLQPAY